MRRLVPMLAVAALVAGMASAGGAAPAEAVVGIVSAPDGNAATYIARLDPVTLKELSPRAEIGEYHGTWSLAPDGSHRLAVGLSASGEKGRVGIRIFDLDTMKKARDIETGIYGAALAWPQPRRIVAALGSGAVRVRDPRTGRWRSRTIGGDVRVIDPETGRTLHRRSLGASTLDAVSAATPRGLVMVVPRAGVARLIRLDAGGGLKSVTLWRMPLRLRRMARGGSIRERAGLAVDPAGDHAYLFAAGSLAVEVDLRTMRASYHAVSGDGDILARPTRKAPFREALWLGDGLVAVSGADRRLSNQAEAGAGAAVFDTARWTARAIDPRARGVALSRDRLLAFGAGVRAYRFDGAPAFRALTGSPVDRILTAGDRAYVVRWETVRVLDTATGKVLARPSARLGLTDVIPG